MIKVNMDLMRYFVKKKVKMDAKELMIGDWVKLMNSKGECIDYSQLDENLFCIAIRDGEDGCLYFSPIPLTAEILEKNKFIWKEDNGYFALWLNDQDGIFATPTRNGMWNVQAQSSQFKISCNICYLHVLQHILRLFGLGDIANNFKIEAK